MSSHRAGRRAIESRAAGHRRVAGVTTVSAVSGTGLAVLFGSLFAQAAASPVVAATQAAPVEAAAAINPAGAPAQAGTTKHPAAGTHAPATTAKSSQPAPRPPAAAPRSAQGAPTASSGGS